MARKWQAILDYDKETWCVMNEYSFRGYARSVLCYDEEQAHQVALALNRLEE
jgi:hypothetical protein